MADSCRAYWVLSLLWASLLLSCTREQDYICPPEGKEAVVTSVLHYRAMVGEGLQTKASLNNLNQYIFETGDQLYVTSGNDLYGVLNLVAGAGDPNGTFEGDLMCLGGFVPTDATNLSATLVSRDDKIHTCADGKITETAYPEPNSGVDGFASSFPEAVRYFSNFTATNRFDAHAFSLEQQSAFLIFSVTFDDTEAGTISSSGSSTITATISNNGSPVRSGEVTVEEVDFSEQTYFVAAFLSGTTLDHATVTFETTGHSSIGSGDSITDASLQANHYYEVSRSHVDLTYFTVQAREDGTTVTFNYTGTIEYSVNGGSWTPITTPIPTLNQKDYVQFRGQRTTYNTDGTPIFTSDKPVFIYGDIMSLICDGGWNKNNVLVTRAFQYALKNSTEIDIPAGRPLSLSAITLNTYCYNQMFQGCTSLTRPPKLQTTLTSNVPNYAYAYMFNGCSSLASAPELPSFNSTAQDAISVGQEGYRDMFYGCNALITVPASIVGTSGKMACYEMFYGCTSLTNAPAPTSDTVGEKGYYRMFRGCTSLVSAPELPASTFGINCYQEMFYGCTSLISAPTSLPATTLSTSCYQDMFNGCLSLSSAPAELPATYSDSVSPSNCYKGMFNGCISLNHAPEIKLVNIGENSCQQMFYGCTSLVVAEGLDNATTVGVQGCYQMFAKCGELTTTPLELKATTVPNKAYYQMYYNCAKITEAPAIKATSVASESCYQMFYGCRRLRRVRAAENAEVPTLAVGTVTEKAFKEMFSGCTSLAVAPAFTEMTTVELEGCMNMYYGCTNLKTAPELPATELNTSAYKGMFQGSGLATVPELLATTLAESCYESMFQNCKYLEGPAVLPAKILTTKCYKNMFNGSTLLNSVVCLATTNISEANCDNWLNGVAATGTFVRPTGATAWTIDSASGIPTGWTVQDSGLDPIFPDDGPFNPEEDL